MRVKVVLCELGEVLSESQRGAVKNRRKEQVRVDLARRCSGSAGMQFLMCRGWCGCAGAQAK